MSYVFAAIAGGVAGLFFSAHEHDRKILFCGVSTLRCPATKAYALIGAVLGLGIYELFIAVSQ